MRILLYLTLKRINKGKVKRCISSVSPIGGDIAFSDLQVQPSPRTEQTPEDKRRTTLTSREEAHCSHTFEGAGYTDISPAKNC